MDDIIGDILPKSLEEHEDELNPHPGYLVQVQAAQPDPIVGVGALWFDTDAVLPDPLILPYARKTAGYTFTVDDFTIEFDITTAQVATLLVPTTLTIGKSFEIGGNLMSHNKGS